MVKQKFPVYLISAIATFILAATVNADSVATKCSYSIRLEQSNLVFVMIADQPSNECLSQGKERAAAANLLRKTYGASGLYREGDSTPLWTVDWYSYRVFVSSDGKYLVRTGPWASAMSDEAFSFFSDGNLLKRYTVNEIIRYQSALPQSVSHFQWEKNLSLVDDNRTFEVTTLEDGSLTFSIENGELLSKKLPILPPIDSLVNPKFYISNLLTIGLTIGGLAVLVYVFYRFTRTNRLA